MHFDCVLQQAKVATKAKSLSEIKKTGSDGRFFCALEVISGLKRDCSANTVLVLGGDSFFRALLCCVGLVSLF